MKKCLVTGAYGFIGRQLVASFLSQGWEVTGAGRDIALARRLIPDIEWIACDFNRDLDPDVWADRLRGFDVVVNCVGILQSTAVDDAARIHGEASNALFVGAERAEVSRFIHLSAMSAEAHIETDYSTTRLNGEQALAETSLNWVIVKPSLVVGGGSYGGTSLMRGLAGLPYVLPLPGDGAESFQPIMLEELARGIVCLASNDKPERVMLYAAGPETLSVREIVLKLRHWLGFGSVKVLPVPEGLLRPFLWLGDVAGWFGEASAMRTASLDQMKSQDIVDPEPFQNAVGFKLSSLSSYLLGHPSNLQDRLHARSYFAVPVLRVLLALFWMFTGGLSLIPPVFAQAVELLGEAGISTGLASGVVWIGSIADMILGLLMLSSRHVRVAGLGQIGLTLGYLAVLSLLLTGLWADPLGPLLKVVPLIGAALVVMAFAEER